MKGDIAASRCLLSAQMLRQIEGFAIILLRAEGADEEDEDETGVDDVPTSRGR
jgi:hypothetical protein